MFQSYSKAFKKDVFVTKNGKVIAKITSPYKSRLDTVNELFGCLSGDMTLDEAMKERLKKI